MKFEDFDYLREVSLCLFISVRGSFIACHDCVTGLINLLRDTDPISVLTC